MKHYQVPFIKGVVKDIHPRLIPDDKASDVMNMIFKEQSMSPRWGYAVYGGNMPLNGQISAITLFRKNDGNKILCAFTNRDAYYYDSVSAVWKFFTKIHTTGTAGVVAGSGTSATVTGSSSAWDTNWDADNVFQIKFGDKDPNASGTWYTISSIASATSLTIDTAISTVASGEYVIRMRFTGNDDNIFSIAYPYDASYTTTSYVGTEDKILVVTNGVDAVMKWEGDITGGKMLEDLNNEILDSGTPVTIPIAKYVNFFGSKDFGHTILSWLIEGAVSYPQRIESSNAGFPTQWDGNQNNFYDTQDEIVGIKSLQDRMIVYKQESMTEMFVNVTGGNSDPFDYRENKIRDIGTPSIRTVHEFGSYHIFLSWDNVYLFDGVSVTPVGSDVIENMIRQSNRAYLSKSFALTILAESLYCLFIPTGESEYPDKCFVYNYREKFWTLWDLTHTIDSTVVANMTAEGFSFKEYSPTWAEVEADANAWNNWEYRWTDLIIFEDNMSYLLGDSDGYIYDFSPAFSDDLLTVSGVNYTEEIECMIETKDFPLNDPKHTVKICELVIGMIRFSSGSLRVRASVDFGANWSAWITIPNTATTGDALYVEHIANFVQRGRQARFQLENVDGADFEIESLIIGFNDNNGRVSQSNI